MTPWLLFTLIALATYRGSRLIVEDKITEPVVGRIQTWAENRWVGKSGKDRKLDPDTWQSYLGYALNCYHCCSIYVAAAIVIAVDCFASMPLPVLWWAGACAVTSVIASILSTMESVSESMEAKT